MKTIPRATTTIIGLFLIALCVSALTSCMNRKTNQTDRIAPKTTLRIASMSPAATAILFELGLAESLVAADAWSARLGVMPKDIPLFDMMKPDVERLAETGPDILFVSTITQAGTSQDPFAPLSAAGVKVVYLPVSADISGIAADIMLIADLTDRSGEGKKVVTRMNDAVAEIRTIAKGIPDSKRQTVIFEISPAPFIYSFGRGVYLNELIEAAGAINALNDETGWMAVSAEAIIARDPDVILTNVETLADPVAEIYGRKEWKNVKAVKNGRVYKIDSASSSQPSPGIALALKQIAEAVYPEYYR